MGVELLHSSPMMVLGDFRNPHNVVWLVHIAVIAVAWLILPSTMHGQGLLGHILGPVLIFCAPGMVFFMLRCGG